MAYARRSRFPRRRAFKRRSAPRRSRRYVAKRPSRTRRRAMPSRRSILNLTTTKKRDNMAPAFYRAGDGVTATPVNNGIALLATMPAYTTAHCVLWCATEREYASGSNMSDHGRRSHTPFYKGLSERIRMKTTNSSPWLWRRIVFTMKGPLPETIRTSIKVGNQYKRGITWLTDGSDVGNSVNGLVNTTLFAGSAGIDWNDVMLAKTDTQALTVMYDRTIQLKSGSDSGTIRDFKMCHPMNKTLVYAYDESGTFDVSFTRSALGRAGMGDMYIYDMFQPHDFSVDGGTIEFNPKATLYWHEK
ncbi:capsid protein [Lama associated gemycircularvirus 1]|uniref:Capsid protein n=1 Tax=Lama associated gemycircularvirus 1 TaxID=1985385 RepID=A0A160HWM3_9VIRU|nr:capsid protein [Lama associated gemycircularvirus 1]ANC51584.1 capsid protein [Lama associated gemycircularvirus 1]